MNESGIKVLVYLLSQPADVHVDHVGLRIEVIVPYRFQQHRAGDDLTLVPHHILEQLKLAFEKRHEELYTYSLKEQQPVLINARVATVGLLPAPPSEPSAAGLAVAPPSAERDIYLGEWVKVPVYDFTTLAAGQVIDGPAIVESDTTTVLLRSGDRATTTEQRWLDIVID